MNDDNNQHPLRVRELDGGPACEYDFADAGDRKREYAQHGRKHEQASAEHVERLTNTIENNQAPERERHHHQRVISDRFFTPRHKAEAFAERGRTERVNGQNADG